LRFGLTEAQQFRRLACLFREAHRRGIAGENDVIEMPLPQLGRQGGENLFALAELLGPTEQTQVDPRRHAFVEPIAQPPIAAGRGEVNIAEMSQANGGGSTGINGVALLSFGPYNGRVLLNGGEAFLMVSPALRR
jgi:hypothetical protein